MNKEELFGEIISPDLLELTKSKRLLQYITSDNCSYVELVEIRQKNNHNEETIIINLNIERPQKPKIDIRRIEPIAIIFYVDDISAPKVYMLRNDFPLTSHQNIQPEKHPKSLCLTELPYNIEKLTWTPSYFINQIQFWLKKTAIAQLHNEDQALEPFIFSSSYNLIVPKNFDIKEPLINIYKQEDGNNLTLFLHPEKNGKKAEFITIGLKLPKTEHGIIRYIPLNLSDLASLLSEVNFDLNNELQQIFKSLILDETHVNLLDKKIVFFFSVPLTRSLSSDVEKTDYFAFLTSKTLKDIGIIYGILEEIKDSSFKSAGLIIGKKLDIGDTKKIGLMQLKIRFFLDSNLAALCNNVPFYNENIVAIGLGSLGSQIINNLIRSGFGKWKLIDEDIFLPHNAARHILSSLCSGYSKINVCRNYFNNTIDEILVDEALCIDILNPNQNEKDKLLNIMKDQKFIFDFSASIAVSRYLANNDIFTRTLSAYLTPDGKNLIIATEDEKREFRLDWLEMLHYREVINKPELSNSLNTASYHRYGNSCRDISVQLPQDDFSIWSGFASKRIREIVFNNNASLDIFYRSDYDIRQIKVDIHDIKKFKISFWEIIFDDYLVNKMYEFREKSLPNETGGVLLGSFDNEHEKCYIIDFISSPSDSEELPLSFIRGYDELQNKVKSIEEKTLGQVKYIGEWHSHPNNCSVIPSLADSNTFDWLKSIMDHDSLPSIMMIIGENKVCCIIGAEPSP
jgi:integrative and conjugative element protein (TIGR02256 family)